uniref:CS domain-containing protein n=2 Tax=Ascaris TaxID=6251 RepID=F1LDJ8_ASCSU
MIQTVRVALLFTYLWNNIYLSSEYHSMAAKPLHPLVQWAQRESCLYLTVEIDKVEQLNVTPKDLHVKGRYAGAETEYEATVEFYADVKTDYRKIDSDRHLELVLNKEAAGWWPRLLKAQGKIPWVKVDFNKWKDEDDEEDDLDGGPGGFDFSKYMADAGAGGGGGAPNLDDFDDEDEDTEDMPELEDTADDEVEKKKGETKEGEEHLEPKTGTAAGDTTEQVSQKAA